VSEEKAKESCATGPVKNNVICTCGRGPGLIVLLDKVDWPSDSHRERTRHLDSWHQFSCWPDTGFPDSQIWWSMLSCYFSNNHLVCLFQTELFHFYYIWFC